MLTFGTDTHTGVLRGTILRLKRMPAGGPIFDRSWVGGRRSHHPNSCVKNTPFVIGKDRKGKCVRKNTSRLPQLRTEVQL